MTYGIETIALGPSSPAEDLAAVLERLRAAERRADMAEAASAAALDRLARMNGERVSLPVVAAPIVPEKRCAAPAGHACAEHYRIAGYRKPVCVAPGVAPDGAIIPADWSDAAVVLAFARELAASVPVRAEWHAPTHPTPLGMVSSYRGPAELAGSRRAVLTISGGGHQEVRS